MNEQTTQRRSALSDSQQRTSAPHGLGGGPRPPPTGWEAGWCIHWLVGWLVASFVGGWTLTKKFRNSLPSSFVNFTSEHGFRLRVVELSFNRFCLRTARSYQDSSEEKYNTSKTDSDVEPFTRHSTGRSCTEREHTKTAAVRNATPPQTDPDVDSFCRHATCCTPA